jgi:hypothetical protein
MRLPQPGGPGPCIYIPQELGGRVIPPGTGFDVKAEVKMRPTVSRPVCLGVELSSGTLDQLVFFCLTIVGVLILDTLSGERMGL